MKKIFYGLLIIGLVFSTSLHAVSSEKNKINDNNSLILIDSYVVILPATKGIKTVKYNNTLDNRFSYYNEGKAEIIKIVASALISWQASYNKMGELIGYNESSLDGYHSVSIDKEKDRWIKNSNSAGFKSRVEYLTDSDGKITKSINDDGDVKFYFYDDENNLIKMTTDLSKNIEKKYYYDGDFKLIKIVLHDNSSIVKLADESIFNGDIEENEFFYDSNNELSKFIYTIRLISPQNDVWSMRMIGIPTQIDKEGVWSGFDYLIAKSIGDKNTNNIMINSIGEISYW